MPFLNFGGNKNKYCNLSDMNFFIKNMKNIKNRYSDPDPLFPNVVPRIRIRIHVKMRWIRNAGFNYHILNLCSARINLNTTTASLGKVDIGSGTKIEVNDIKENTHTIFTH